MPNGPDPSAGTSVTSAGTSQPGSLRPLGGRQLPGRWRLAAAAAITAAAALIAFFVVNTQGVTSPAPANSPGSAAGPPVVLIHGWLFSRQAFARQMNGELADRCRVVAYDLRGHGESGKPKSLSDYSDGAVWAADLHCVLESVGIERPVLAGWSLGGRVAAHYVFVKGPERVAGVNLVAARILQPLHTPTSVLPGHSIEATTDFVRSCTNSPFSAADDELFLRAALAVPPVARQGASAWHVDYGSFFDELELPVLVTHGSADPLTPTSVAENIARRLRGQLPSRMRGDLPPRLRGELRPRLRGQLSIYPDCGHMPFWEQPARFNRELAEFAQQALSFVK